MSSETAGLLKDLNTKEITRINILARISKVLNSDLPPNEMFKRLLKLLCVSMKAERGFLELSSRSGEPVRFSYDFSQEDSSQDFPYTKSLVQQCLEENKPMVLFDGPESRPTASMLMAGIRSVLVHPLVGKAGLKGVVYMDSLLQSGEFRHNDLELLGIFGDMVAIALERHQKDLELQSTQRSLADAAHGTIVRLSDVAEFRDQEGGGHLERVSLYTELIANKLRMDPGQVATLKTASKMHDIGKLGIPDSILLKPGRFTDFERKIMQEHTVIGARILGGSGNELLSVARTVALTHHEKWDGTGYPENLKKEEIPLVGRVVALADVFDAITSKRRYKSAYPLDGAFELLEKESGSHFDPQLAKIFQECRMEVEQIFHNNPDPPDPKVEIVSDHKQDSIGQIAVSEAGILLVDPDHYFGESLVTEATKRNAYMTQVYDVSQAREKIESYAPTAILLEATLEGAEEFVVGLNDSHPKLRINILSEDGSFSQRVKYSRLGVCHYLQKPVPAKHVMDKVFRELGGVGVLTPRILVLDDDALQLNLVSKILQRYDSEVICISDPLELWEKLPEFSPDLLILDLEMPRVSGFEICRVLRSSGRWAHLPIVVITGHEDADYYSRALEAGADDVLAKPLRPRTLLSRLDSRLQRTRAIQRGASVEPVTGLVALWQAREAGHQLTGLALRLNSMVTAGLLTIKNFEDMKQKVGRAEADSIQREIATSLVSGLRSEDVLTRVDDGCFLAAFPGSSKEHVRVVLESINAKLQKMEPPVELQSTIVSTPEDGTGIDELIAKLTNGKP